MGEIAWMLVVALAMPATVAGRNRVVDDLSRVLAIGGSRSGERTRSSRPGGTPRGEC